MSGRRASNRRFYYGVAKGRNAGVYDNWFECKKQVDGFANARFKKFSTLSEAQQFVDLEGRSHRYAPYNTSTSRKKAVAVYRSNNSVAVEVHEQLQTSNVKSKSGQKSVVVYTDGACCNNGFSGAKAGIGVYWPNGEAENISEPLPGRPTNNRAEIHAAIRAIEEAKKLNYNEVIVHTDSQFLINSITKWLKKWIANGWKLANGGSVVNREDFEELTDVMNGINVKWEKVAAHSGDTCNDAADQLAVVGASK